MSEQFKDAGPCPIRSFEIQGETVDPGVKKHVGKLWTGAEWITVEQARALRNWLTEILP